MEVTLADGRVKKITSALNLDNGYWHVRYVSEHRTIKRTDVPGRIVRRND
jgi:hypothetical protein